MLFYEREGMQKNSVVVQYALKISSLEITSVSLSKPRIAEQLVTLLNEFC